MMQLRSSSLMTLRGVAAAAIRGVPLAGAQARPVTRGFRSRVSEQVVGDVVLTNDDVKEYRKNGFIKVPHILSAAQLEQWRSAVDSAVDARVKDATKYSADERSEYNNEFVQGVNLWQTHDTLAHILSSAKGVLGRMACQLAGLPAVRVYHDRALYQEPYSNPLPWSVDMPHWSFTSPDALSIWIALDDICVEDGCLHFLPGSHKIIQKVAKREGQFREVGLGPNMNSIFDEVPELLQSELEPECLEMKAGDCVFHNGMLVYAAGPNMTPNHRRAMTIQLMPVGSIFNGKRGVLTQAEFEQLKIGDSLDDDERHPLMYSMDKT